jgi:uncharacterized protein
MIQQRNISKLANRLYTEARDRVGKKLALRIQETTLERDYCLAWLLCSLTAHPVLSEALAFKGGTALRRVHFGEYRFSEDLDFTLIRDLTLDAIFGAFDEVFDKLYEESEIRFRRSNNEPTRHVRNDTFYFNYKGPLRAENKVKVDVTRGETVVFALERKPVLGTYEEFSDLPSDKLLQVYSNEGHVPHGEDLIYGLNRKLASREGRVDDVLVSRLDQVEKTLRQRWDHRLCAQVVSLPEFDGCYRDVKRLLSDFDKLRETDREAGRRLTPVSSRLGRQAPRT